MSEETMRAVRFHTYGPPDVLVVEDVPRPEPQEGEVLVHVHAAGVNPIDWKLRAGYLQQFMPVQLPYTPNHSWPVMPRRRYLNGSTGRVFTDGPPLNRGGLSHHEHTTEK